MKITFEKDDGQTVIWTGINDEDLSNFLNITAVAKHFNININTASARVSRGWCVLKALATE
ncbi:hypothetical protein [Pantoea sp. Taur]|uniref:hypothetical protein n=1 Tax=Pantoea sp. Taur TaxID=2576757 RepID=UPI001354E12C|nr:hypothetical protein [Pantoea sp. Taur]MXP59553.1 hypothetical protein [Pantoea sp. Taur]